jgi:hypothetical protein
MINALYTLKIYSKKRKACIIMEYAQHEQELPKF